jgi:hypothetical protein
MVILLFTTCPLHDNVAEKSYIWMQYYMKDTNHTSIPLRDLFQEEEVMWTDWPAVNTVSAIRRRLHVGQSQLCGPTDPQ